jgi:hypothetical protein
LPEELVKKEFAESVLDLASMRECIESLPEWHFCHSFLLSKCCIIDYKKSD